jgi:AcrR family transcriptional regulator
MPAQVPHQRTARAEQTRALIVDVALDLFTSRGYEATTMRAIAQKAGVATGNAYYYFASKEELVGEFYSRAVADHEHACRPVLDAQAALAPRLRGVLHALIEVQEPYRPFAAPLCARAAVPSPARDRSLAIFTEVAQLATTKMPSDVRERLPGMLWLCATGIGQFWSRDTSDGAQRTIELINATAPLTERAVRFARYPLLRGLTRDLLSVAEAL